MTFTCLDSDNMEVQQQRHQQNMENEMHSIDNLKFTMIICDNQLNEWLANLPPHPDNQMQCGAQVATTNC
mgnify:CR=1 FL=1